MGIYPVRWESCPLSFTEASRVSPTFHAGLPGSLENICSASTLAHFRVGRVVRANCCTFVPGLFFVCSPRSSGWQQSIMCLQKSRFPMTILKFRFFIGLVGFLPPEFLPLFSTSKHVFHSRSWQYSREWDRQVPVLMEIVFWMWAREIGNKQNNFPSRQYRAYSREPLGDRSALGVGRGRPVPPLRLGWLDRATRRRRGTEDNEENSEFSEENSPAGSWGRKGLGPHGYGGGSEMRPEAGRPQIM